jgi:segregation and condensation protein B
MVNGDDISVVSRPEFSTLIESFRKEELKGDLTPATLQVLTLVAYLGSPTREEISYIRGVQSSQSVRTLSVRGLISRSGEVCTLTENALKHLGITSPSLLPDYERIHNELLQKLAEREL